MEPREYYTLKDSKRYARKEFPNEFGIFRDIYTGKFETKTYLDENNAAHGVNVLFVGHYHIRKGGPPVWAQATATGVRYFQGRPTEEVCTLIPEEQVSRIYYSTLYSSMIGPQQGRGRTAGRKAGQHLVETIVNVLFLLTSRLKLINNPNKTNMLSNFKFACLNAVRVGEVEPSIAIPQSDLAPAHGLDKQQNRKRKRAPNDHSQRIKQEENDGDMAPVAAYPTGGLDGTPELQEQQMEHLSRSPIPCRPTSNPPHASLLDQIRNYEATMADKLEQEKRMHAYEVRILRSKLDALESRIRDAEETATREKKERERVEEQLEEIIKRDAMRGQKMRSLQAQHKQQHDNWRLKEVELMEAVAQKKRALRNIEAALANRNRTIAALSGDGTWNGRMMEE